MTTPRHLKPLLPLHIFIFRVLRGITLAAIAVSIALGIGASGYHYFEGLDWLDATLNASMILTGMGPVNNPTTHAGKIFAICYALFSGLVFLTAAGFLITPVARRILHDLHLKINIPEDAVDRHDTPPGQSRML